MLSFVETTGSPRSTHGPGQGKINLAQASEARKCPRLCEASEVVNRRLDMWEGGSPFRALGKD